MRVGLLQEGDFKGTTCAERYHEMLDEVVAAEALGFSTWGTSEQHFSPPHFSVASPEVLYAAAAARTSRITLRNMSAVLVLYNHPILVAERMATLDIVSRGRAELCTARSNNFSTLEAFGVSPEDTQAQWEESIEIVLRAWTEETLEHDGRFWKIPPRQVVPKPYQSPHPAVSTAASSVKSHGIAGRKGIGVIGFDNYLGFDYVAECVQAYKAGIAEAQPIAPAGINDYVGLYIPSPFCAETREEAFAVAEDATLSYFGFIEDLYKRVSGHKGYEYMARLEELHQHANDVEFLVETTPSVMIGTPDDFIERLRRLEEIGVDEVLLRVDGFGHERNLQTMELIGREVIPAVDPQAAQTLAAG
jgi:alkanesulfonate monooxygenase SsuD/methylene tetrahydromethanopterin reductase-like flavin-dependent oxidoreductase (luciferase family)